jgi:SAM-dependent methyltransferase
MPESAADFVMDIYQANAALWVEMRGRALFEQPWLDRFLSNMPLGGQDVLDLGCGSGHPIAGYLIDKGCRITGVDGASALIGIARESFPEHTWLTADMRSLPPLGAFHGIVAWHSLFHLKPEDQRMMFGAFKRLSLPGAALMFTSGTEFGERIGSFGGQPLYHGSLDSAEYRHLLWSNDFDVVQHIEDDSTCGGATIWLARKMIKVS